MTSFGQLPLPTFSPQLTPLSPKSALFVKIYPPLLGESNKKLFEFSSPKLLGNIIQLPRGRKLSFLTDKKNSKRCISVDLTPTFSQNLYERVDTFFDDENLHVVSPSPAIRQKFMRTDIRLAQFSTTMDPNSIDLDSDLEALSQNLPSILLRRTSSTGMVKSVKQSLSKLESPDSSDNAEVSVKSSFSRAKRLTVIPIQQSPDFDI